VIGDPVIQHFVTVIVGKSDFAAADAAQQDCHESYEYRLGKIHLSS
jgi:hypothetical protein